MKTHELTIWNHPYPFLDRIIDGSKTIEGRTYSPFFQKIEVGDRLKLFNREKWVLCEIKALRRYETFRQMLEKETLQRVLPGHLNIDTAIQMYRKFPHFEENEKRYGVVAIEIETISSGNF